MKKGMKKVLAYAAAAVMSVSAIKATDVASFASATTGGSGNEWAKDLVLELPDITVQTGDKCVKLTWEPFNYENVSLPAGYEYEYSYLYCNINSDYLRGEREAETGSGELIINGLQNNREIELTIQGGICVNTAAGRKWSKDSANGKRISVTPGTAEKPVVSATPTAGGADVTWSAVNGAVKYRVFTFAGSGKIRQFGSDTAETSMTVKGLNGGQKTGIIVLAQFANKKWSTYTEDDIAYVTPLDAVKPYLCVNPKGDGNYYLIWSSVPTSVRYKVMAREKGTDNWELIGATRQRCRITVQLDPNKEYEFLVRGLNSRGKYTPMDADDIVCG